MIPVYSGSKNRIIFPLSKLIDKLNLFVEPQEYSAYKMIYKKYNIIKLPQNDQGFGYLLNRMLDYARENKHKYFMFIDDDILGFKTRKDKKTTMDEILMDSQIIMEKNNYSQLMISFAGHNWFYKGEVKEKIGAWCMIINKTEDLINAGGYDEQLPIFNDWDMSAKLIKKGYKTACYYKYKFNHKMKSMSGGASIIYKKQMLLNKAIDMLKEKYGEECIKVVMCHNQREARFRWKNL